MSVLKPSSRPHARSILSPLATLLRTTLLRILTRDSRDRLSQSLQTALTYAHPALRPILNLVLDEIADDSLRIAADEDLRRPPAEYVLVGALAAAADVVMDSALAHDGC